MTIGVDATDESLNNSNLVPGEDAESLHIDRNENPDTVDITDDGLEIDMNIVDPNKDDNVENSDPGTVPPKKKKKNQKLINKSD